MAEPDIVERLRSSGGRNLSYWRDLFFQAADEIERLRGELERAQTAAFRVECGEAVAALSAAERLLPGGEPPP